MIEANEKQKIPRAKGKKKRFNFFHHFFVLGLKKKEPKPIKEVEEDLAAL